MSVLEYGIIDTAHLYIDDHSCFVLDIGMKLSGSGYVSFGNVSLGHRDEPLVSTIWKEGDPTNYGIYFIARVLKIFGANSLDELKGQACRAIIKDNLCVGIMNYLQDDLYFIPRNDFPEDGKPIDSKKL